MSRLPGCVQLAVLLMTSLGVAGCRSEAAADREADRSSSIALVGGTLVHPDREGEAALEHGRILVISEGRIDRILPESEGPPPGARIVDARGKWIIPGLVDAHVHFFQSGTPYARPDIMDRTNEVPYRAEVERNMARIDATLQVWTRSGVTGVADLGGPEWNFEVRELARETPSAPYVAVAGPLLSTVSRPELAVLGMEPIRRVQTPQQAAAEARAQAQRRPDYLKFWFIHRPGDDLGAQTELLEAVARVADAEGIPLVVHATELRLAKIAIRAGARILAHSVDDQPVDDEFLQLARESEVIYIPTLFVQRGYALVQSSSWEPTPAERRLADPEVLAMMDARGAGGAGQVPGPPRVAMENLRRVWSAGITVAAGSDAGNVGTLHGPGLFRELEWMERAGLSPREVLLAATLHGARVLGRDGVQGRLLPGFSGDVVVLDQNPLESTAHLSRIHRVIAGGRIIDPDLFGPRAE